MAMSGDETELDRAVTGIGEALKRIPTTPGRDEWLRTIYNGRVNRFVLDNGTIWRTGAIMVPISLAAFAVPVQKDVSSGWALLVLALASIFILLTWIWVSENHRAFQNKSIAIMTAIEREIVGFKDPWRSPKVNDLPRFLRIFTAKRTGQVSHWVLFAFLIVGWVLMFLALWHDLQW